MQVGDLLTRHFGSGDPKRAKPHAIRKIRSNLLSEAKKGKIRQPSSYTQFEKISANQRAAKYLKSAGNHTQLEKSVQIKKIRFIRFPVLSFEQSEKENPKSISPSLF